MNSPLSAVPSIASIELLPTEEFSYPRLQITMHDGRRVVLALPGFYLTMDLSPQVLRWISEQCALVLRRSLDGE